MIGKLILFFGGLPIIGYITRSVAAVVGLGIIIALAWAGLHWFGRDD